MSDILRFGVSIEQDLLDKFDKQISKKGYKNRSEAIRDLIRNQLVDEEWQSDKDIVGTLTIVYDHHTKELGPQLTHMQHSFTGNIMSVLHVHLDHHNCLEVLVVKGRSREIRRFADKIVSMRGIKHGKLTMTTTGKRIPSNVDQHSH